ncbi:MAG: protein TolR [Gammaproteobacteria bacterium]|nr:protein TolR [Gammaproteobacteria bacterium]
MAIYNSRSRKKKLMGEINVVPYIDVMLVLLIIFMITAPLLTEGVQVDLPQADARTVDTEDKEPFVVTVDSDGNYFVNDEPDQERDPEAIRIKAAAVLKHNPETPFLVRGDGGVRYELVVQAMVLLQQAGVASVGLVTETPASN